MRFRALGFAGSLVLGLLAFTSCRPPESSSPLSREVYVWQRAHTGAVTDSVRARSSDFDRLVVLAAEISWADGHAQIVRVPADAVALGAAREIGLAIRINAFSGPFSADSESTRSLVELTSSLLVKARADGLSVTELQIDFDASAKRLPDYRRWLVALRPAVPASVRLTFTALPSWLKQHDDFAALAAAADGYVLQVHSLTRPATPDNAVALCDPSAAAIAIATAARFGRPFRVALPTYGYRLAFTTDGKFFALSTEGPVPDWPAETITRELSADPSAMAALTADLLHRHPQALTGIIWYRLPVAGDRLNWAWPTLAAVMKGETPVAHVALEAHADGHGLVEYEFVNTGNAPFTGAFAATVAWTGAHRVASDSLPPFALENESDSSQRLTTSLIRLAPGGRQSAGWLRLDHAPLSLHVSPSH